MQMQYANSLEVNNTLFCCHNQNKITRRNSKFSTSIP